MGQSAGQPADSATGAGATAPPPATSKSTGQLLAEWLPTAQAQNTQAMDMLKGLKETQDGLGLMLGHIGHIMAWKFGAPPMPQQNTQSQNAQQTPNADPARDLGRDFSAARGSEGAGSSGSGSGA